MLGRWYKMEKTTKVFNDFLKRLKDDYERKINEIKKIQETLVYLRNKDLSNPESNDISVIESILSSDEIEEI